MATLRLLNSGHWLLVITSSLLWVLLPLIFQNFLHSLTATVEHKNLAMDSFSSTSWLTLCLLMLVALIFLLDFKKFKLFVRQKPEYAKGQSLVSQLAQDRIWSTDLPSFLGSILISIGGLVVLMFRDVPLSLMVVTWFSISYLLQRFSQRSVGEISQKFSRGKNKSATQISLQSQLLTRQVFASGLSNTLRVAGQVLIYLILFYQFSIQQRSQLPEIIANIEYVALILSHLQMTVSSLPKIQELQEYIRIKKKEEQKTPLIQSA